MTDSDVDIEAKAAGKNDKSVGVIENGGHRRRTFMARIYVATCCCLTLALLTVSMATDHWISVNGAYRNATDQRVICNHTFLIGLWRKCRRDYVTVFANSSSKSTNTFEIGVETCSVINYFSTDDANSNPESLLRAVGYFTGELSHGNSLNSAVNMKMSSWAFLSGLVLLATATLLSFISLCARNSAPIILIFSGIALIKSGVGVMCGLIIYIQSASSELSPRSKQVDSQTEGTEMSYRFSVSFGLAVISFFCTELTGVFCLYLCVKNYRQIISQRMMQVAKIANPNLLQLYEEPASASASASAPPPTPRDAGKAEVLTDRVNVQTGLKLANARLSKASRAEMELEMDLQLDNEQATHEERRKSRSAPDDACKETEVSGKYSLCSVDLACNCDIAVRASNCDMHDATTYNYFYNKLTRINLLHTVYPTSYDMSDSPYHKVTMV